MVIIALIRENKSLSLPNISVAIDYKKGPTDNEPA